MVKTMILKSVFIACTTLISLFSISTCFTTELIHRDSPQSPSYNPSLSPYQRLAHSLQRSQHRAKRFTAARKTQSPVAEITNAGSEYLMKYAIGTPPVPSLGVADTGSDLTWTQCQPCKKCFKQKLPLFVPKNSSTYKNLPCNSDICDFNDYDPTSCSDTNSDNCGYTLEYADDSFSYGDVATETITFASTDGQKDVSAPNVIFGCGFDSNLLVTSGESGVVGLGGGPASLVRRLGPLANGKFSYCLTHDNSRASKLSFGDSAVVSGKGVVTTPLVPRPPETFYFLTLEGISVGNQRLGIPANKSGARGNIIVDSGSRLTTLPFDLYGKVETALKGAIKLKQIKDPQGDLSLCFFSKEDNITIPDITVHFEGADVKLKQENLFVRTSNESLCFAAQTVEAENDVGIYGNVAQKNFLVGYDLQKKTVSFKAANC